MECLDRRHLGHFGLRHGGRGQRRRRRHPGTGRGTLERVYTEADGKAGKNGRKMDGKWMEKVKPGKN